MTVGYHAGFILDIGEAQMIDVIGVISVVLFRAIEICGTLFVVGGACILMCWFSNLIIDRMVKAFELQTIFYKCCRAHFKAKADARRGGVI